LVICVISAKIAPPYRDGDTVKLLRCETAQFISPVLTCGQPTALI